jgi:hypothetical protein
MKQYILSGVALLALMLPSCSEDNLEIPKKGVVTADMFYQNPENAENAVAYVYERGMAAHTVAGNYTRGCIWQGAIFVLTNAPSDDIYWASWHKNDHVDCLALNEYRKTFNENLSIIKQAYSAYYQMIHASNLMLDYYNYNMVADDETLNKEVNRAVAEAKVSRALAHFMLATLWGNPPKVDHTITGTDQLANTPHDEIINWCIDELAEAAGYLPSKKDQNDVDLSVRFTKEFALALKGKIEVFNGKYDDAKKSLKAVIETGLYDLVPGKDMHKMFHTDGDCSKEWLFQYNYIENVGNFNAWIGEGQFSPHLVKGTSWRLLNFFPNEVVQGWGTMNPTKEFGSALIANDGRDSWRRQSWIVTYDEIMNGKTIGDDVILQYKKSFPHKDAIYGGDTTGLYIDNSTAKVVQGSTYDAETEQVFISYPGPISSGVFGNAGYWEYKRLPIAKDLDTDDKGTDNMHVDVNYPIMRYAEVLLLYAEACAMTQDNDGVKYLNMIQERAGSKHKSTACTMEEVKNEKRFEMFLEGTRYLDLIRWGDAEAVLGNQGGRVPTAYTEIDDSGSPIKVNLVIKWDESATVYGWKAGKNELLPYPYAATSVNKNLKQNPGWE